MAKKERNLGQQKPQDQQQGIEDDRSDRESAKPLQLDNEKMNDEQQQGGQHAQGEKPHQGGGEQHKGGQPHPGSDR